MSSSLFNSESPFWRAVGRFADLVWLNILFLVALIPIVTGGAAFTALYDTAWRLLNESGGGVARMFWASFRSNFAQATAIWSVAGPIGIATLAGWLFLPIEDATVIRAVFTLIYLLVFPYFFFLQARFDNGTVNTLKNSLLIPLTRLPYAAAILLITIVLTALIISTAIYVPSILPPLLMGGFGLTAYAVTPLLMHSVKPWMDRGSADSDANDP